MTSAVTGEEQQQTGDGQDKQSSDNQDQQTGDGQDKQSETREAPPLPSTLNATNATEALNPSNITGVPDGADS
jgi:hypothetical protein